MSGERFAADMLKSYVSRIEEVERHISEFNDDKSDIFKEAKGNGFDVKALKAVIAYRRKDPVERDEQEALFVTYLHALEGKSENGTPVATCARTTPKENTVSISAGTPAPVLKPVQSAPPVPASSTEKLRQDLQASIAAEGMPNIPGFLDRRPS